MRGRVHLWLTTAAGETVGERVADNAVMRGGARLLADLFSGRGRGITHMGVGTNDAPESDAFITAALMNEGEGGLEPLLGTTEAAIAPGAFLPPEVDEVRRLVRVRVRATLPAGAAVGTVREAGLLSRSDGQDPVLYNRVTFAPLAKGADHELTMFWEVSFPYGDLQWLM
jgi:hypothetical protein